jgi:hypothetical protein
LTSVEGEVLLHEGRVNEGRDAFEICPKAFESLDDRDNTAYAPLMLAHAMLSAGDLKNADRSYVEAARLCQQNGDGARAGAAWAGSLRGV